MRGSDERRSARVTPPGLLRGYVDSRPEVRILNLSPAGALIEHADPLSPGATCVLTLRLLGADLRLRAYVVWSRAKEPEGEEVTRYCSGLRLLDPPAAAEATLRQYRPTLRVPKKADLIAIWRLTTRQRRKPLPHHRTLTDRSRPRPFYPRPQSAASCP